MSQHDFNIANQSASSARADINNALLALASQSSGSTEPSTTYANMPWYDSSTSTLKMRSEADDAWISLFCLDQTSNMFKLFDDTQVVNSGGTQTGLLGDQATSVWEAGTGTTESLVSPAKVKAAVEALVPEAIGVNQTWQDVTTSRTHSTSYQNTTGRPIQVSIVSGSGTGRFVEVSTDDSSWVKVGRLGTSGSNPSSFIVPSGHYYRVNGSVTLTAWSELR